MTTIQRNNICNIDGKHSVSLEYKASFKTLEKDHHCTENRRRQWHPTPVLLPGKSYGQRSPVGCSPWGCWGSDTTEWLHFHFSLSCIGKGNGNPLHYSCLENHRDGGAWWAALYGVTQSQTRLKRLSSSIENGQKKWTGSSKREKNACDQQAAFNGWPY